MENFKNLPKHQQAQIEQHSVNYQVKDSLTMYMNLVERCFDTCVLNFRTKHLDNYENKCLQNCSERYIQTTNRAGLRFQEHQAMQMMKVQQQQQQQQK